MSAPPPTRLDEVCAQFPVLRERLHDVAGNFSGGQQQMLAIARGLMSGPKLVLLDEPSLGLSPLLVGEVFRLVQQLRDRGPHRSCSPSRTPARRWPSRTVAT